MMRLKNIVFIALLLLAGCSNIGPATIARDRFDYNTNISTSWKEQTLLNIVKLRYADVPLFLDVASVVSGYSLESSVDFSGGVSDTYTNPGNLSFGSSGKYTDRPTITYSPITGDKFNKTFMTPLPPSAVLFLVQSGWSAEIVLPITVEVVNGLRASRSIGSRRQIGDERFYRMIHLFEEIQQAGALSMRVVAGDDSMNTLLLVLRQKNVAPEVAVAGKELADLLGLRHSLSEYTVTYGEMAANDSELAILTRSLLSIMVELAGQIEVPPEHIAEGRTLAGIADVVDGEIPEKRRLITISHSKTRPDEAFAAVKYKEYWFYIDDRDFKSKQTFAFLMILFSLNETGGRGSLPLVTIPAG